MTYTLRDLEVDLSRAPKRVRSPQGIRRAARRIEREMRVDATGHKGNWFGKAGTSYVIPTPRVSTDLTGDLSAVVGIEARGSGNLFHLLAYGSANNAPAYDPGAGPRRAMPGVLDDLADHAEESVLGRRGK